MEISLCGLSWNYLLASLNSLMEHSLGNALLENSPGELSWETLAKAVALKKCSPVTLKGNLWEMLSWTTILENSLLNHSWKTLLGNSLEQFTRETLGKLSLKYLLGNSLENNILESYPGELSCRTPLENSRGKLSWETILNTSLGLGTYR